MKRLHLTTAWVVLQLVFFGAWAGYEQSRLAPGQGKSILVRTVPVDPRDLLRGQYLQLAYPFSRPDNMPRSMPPETVGLTVWVVLESDGRFHMPVQYLSSRPSRLGRGQVAIRGKVGGGRYLFGIEKYFVSEGSKTPDPNDITVRLRVGDDGIPRIEQVYVKDMPWP